MEQNKTICFLGNRLILNEKTLLKDKIYNKLKTLTQKGYNTFITGAQPGFDTLCAQTLIEMYNEYYFLKLVAVIPYRFHTYKWTFNQEKTYKEILNQCTNIKYLSEYYYYDCYFDWKRYMMNSSSVVMAYYDKNFYLWEKAKLANQTDILLDNLFF